MSCTTVLGIFFDVMSTDETYENASEFITTHLNSDLPVQLLITKSGGVATRFEAKVMSKTVKRCMNMSTAVL